MRGSRSACVVCAGLFALILAAKAEDSETVGFWTFDGTSGQPVVETRDEHVFPNRIVEGGPTLIMRYVGSKAASVPLAIYTNEIQHAYLYGDHGCANRLATTSSSLYMKSTAGSAQYPTYNTSHPDLVVTNIGAAVRTKSFTLEFIAKCHMPLSAGWTSFLSLNKNELGLAPFEVLTTASYQLRVKLLDGSTVKASKNDAFLGMNYNHWIDDGEWHHFAVRWTQDTKTMEIFSDYRLVKSYTLTNNDLLLGEDLFFDLFPYSSGGDNHPDVLIQTVRLTAGDLDQANFLQSSPHATRQTTLAHYRFEGVDGGDLVEARNLALDRADLALFRPNIQSSPAGRPPEYSSLFETQTFPFLKIGQNYQANLTGVRDNPNNASHLRLDMRNKVYLLPESFTHEFLVKPALQVIPSTGSKIIGEKGGPHTDSVYADAAWWMAQRNNALSAGYANFTVYIRVWNGTIAENRSQAIYLTTNEWHHMALTYDNPSRVFKVYLDGLEKKVWTLADGEELVRGTALSVPVGQPDFNQNYGYVGSFDEWRVSSIALEPMQFLQMRRSGGGMRVIIR